MLTLKPIQENDLLQLKSWRNQDNVRNYTREWRLLSDLDQEEWYSSYCKKRKDSDFGQELHMIIDKYNHAIGCGGFVSIQWRNQKAEFSYYIGQDSARDFETIKESQQLLLNKAFNEMNLHKVYWPVFSNDPSVELYKRLWECEGVLSEEYFWDGKWNDRLYLYNFKRTFERLFE